MDTSTGSRADVVVGADGSDLALHAVGWAATEAQLRGLPLRIVHAAPHPVDPTWAVPRSARQILARAFTVARRAEPDVVVSTTRTAQDPATSLLDAAAGAALLVVGMGGGNLPGEVLIGSVALDVGGRAPCPVVVVRGGPVPPRGPVLVGVDTIGGDTAGSNTTRPAVTIRRSPSRSPTPTATAAGWPSCTPDTGPGRCAGRGDEQAADVAARDRLRNELGPWIARFPEVPVKVSVVHGNPTRALLRAAEGSRLVVLGTRGQGTYARTLFGSTSHEVLRRSPVTVMVVKPGTVVTEPDPGEQTLVRSHRTDLDHPHDHSVLF